MEADESYKNDIIYNIKIVFRVLAGHFFGLYQMFFVAKGNNEKLLFSKNTNLVIEGFPRVGNTFYVLAFQELVKRKINIAHHVHLTCQIREALRHDVPVVVLIRDPVEAVLSLKVREPKISIYIAFVWYYFFYKYVLNNKEYIRIKNFDHFTNNYSTIMIEGFEFRKVQDLTVKNIFDRIEKINEQEAKNNVKNRLTTSAPNEEKKKIKEKLKKDMASDTFLERKCYKVYNELIS